uniref:Secreted protein n=1 Tax=Romanomermis culicivorax TaxID=13658 RepID=A0A915HZP5_ROMCU
MFIYALVLTFSALGRIASTAKHCYVPPPVPTAENNFPTFVKFYQKVYDQTTKAWEKERMTSSEAGLPDDLPPDEKSKKRLFSDAECRTPDAG